MAQFQSVIVNKGTGKLGDVVISRWRSKKVVRSYVAKIRNPNSTLQQVYRLKMRIWSKCASFMRGQVTLIWSVRLKQKTEFSSFVQAMLKAADATGVLLTAKLNNFQLGNGKLAGLVPLTIVAGAGKILTVTWSSALFPAGFPNLTATVCLLFINKTGGYAVQVDSAVLFSAGTAAIGVGAGFKAGDEVYCMIGAKNVYTNALTGNTYTWRSRYAGLAVAAFQILVA